MERAHRPVPVMTVSNRRIFVCETFTVNDGRQVDAACALLRGWEENPPRAEQKAEDDAEVVDLLEDLLEVPQMQLQHIRRASQRQASESRCCRLTLHSRWQQREVAQDLPRLLDRARFATVLYSARHSKWDRQPCPAANTFVNKSCTRSTVWHALQVSKSVEAPTSTGNGASAS